MAAWQWFVSTIPTLFLTCWNMLIRFLPYFLAGIMVGEFIKFASWTKIIYKWVSKSPVLAVLSASIIGIISPLCTYGTIPIVIELYKSKVRAAPLITFLAASSLMNPQLFIMTAGGIGVEMAVVRTFAVFVFSCATGMLAYVIPEKFMVRKKITFNDDGGAAIINGGKKSFIVKLYLMNCLKNFRSIVPWLLIGVFLGAAVSLYVPKSYIFAALRAGRLQSILTGAILGIPMNACGGGAIPFIEAMILNGMGKGTALAFFIVGPAMRPAPLLAMAALFTPLFLVGYAVFLVFSAVLMGYVYI